MKSLLPIVLAALALFGVSAAMSVWLYQTKAPAEATDPDKPEKPAKKAKEKEPDRAADKDTADKSEPKAKEKDAGLPKLLPESPTLADIRTREEQLARQTDIRDLVLRDLQFEQDNVDRLRQQVTAEMKAAAAALPTPAQINLDADKRKAEADALEWKNLKALVPKYESMSAEAAAPIFRQMADSGKMDTAAKMLSLMKDRQAGAIIAGIAATDAQLAGQITERILKLRQPPTSPVTPAGGATTP